MRAVAASICTLLLTVAPGAADGAGDRGRARLVVAADAPLTLRGYGFVARERVRVTVRSGERGTSKRVRAGVRGRFRIMFESVTFDRCGEGLEVAAVGDQGTRAVLKVRPQPLCPPRS